MYALRNADVQGQLMYSSGLIADGVSLFLVCSLMVIFRVLATAAHHLYDRITIHARVGRRHP